MTLHPAEKQGFALSMSKITRLLAAEEDLGVTAVLMRLIRALISVSSILHGGVMRDTS